MKFKTLYLFLILFGLSACKLFVSYEQEAKQCNALQSKLDSLKLVYENVPFQEIERVGKASLKKLDSVMNYLSEKGEPLEKETGIFLGQYRGISKPFRKMTENKYRLESEIKYCEDQLKALATDIENKAAVKDSVIVYLQEEKEALKTLESKLNELYSIKDKMVEEFEKNEKKINEIIRSLK